MQLDEIIAKQTQIMDQARDLQDRDDFSPADQRKFDALLAEAKTLGQQAANYRRVNGFSDPGDALTVANSSWNTSNISISHQPAVYRNLGEQMLDVRAMTIDAVGSPAARERYTMVTNAAGASTGSGPDGGYLVETDHAKSIVTTAIETGVFSSRCSIQPIGADSDSFSYLAADDRDRSDNKINGVSVYRKAEAETMANSGKALLKERELRLEDLYGLVYMTNRMLRDAAAMASYTKRVLREQLSFRLDSEIWGGNGAGQCLGVMSSGLPVTVAKEDNQAADTINATNICKMMSRFKGNIRNAAWFVNQDCLSQFPLMTVGNQPVFQADFKRSPFGGLFQLPIVPVEHCKTLGDLGDIVLADWSQYLLVTKGGIEEAESIHVKFLTDETAFRFIMRNNGHPLHDTPITPLNGSNTLSPFVLLGAR